MTALDESRYGFTWGPLAVTRICTGPNGEHVLHISTERRKLEVCVSAKGHSIRAIEVATSPRKKQP